MKAAIKPPLTAYTPKTLCDPEALAQTLTEVRSAGLSLCEGSFDIEVTSMAAPLFDSTGTVIGALAVAMPQGRADAEKLAALRAPLLAAGKAITLSLGGIAPKA